jgi:(1->4)-alpha-D-glucan 1-alpha-D-glucosylmutase
VTHALLALRQGLPDLFRYGTYEPIEAAGPHAGHVVAFARAWKKERLVVVVGRHFAPLTDGGRLWPSGWEATLPLPFGKYRDVFDPAAAGHRNEVSVATLFATLPVSAMQLA